MIVRVRTPIKGPDDDFGNPTTTWQERDWEIRSVAPGTMEERPTRGDRDLSVVMWTLYADAVDVPGPRDQIKLPGTEWFAIEGQTDDWTMGPPRVGPAGPPGIGTPGVVVELRRADG